MVLRVLLFVSFSYVAQAQYYTFQEDVKKSSWVGPMEMSYNLLQATVNLLNWKLNQDPRPLPPVKYNRLQQFGTWIRDPRTQSCMNTRARVLARDSETPVQFADGCRVTKGTWNDPYTAMQFTSATEVDIDHVVALKNAYESGAFNWASPFRCLYTNFLGYKNHLLAVAARENQVKSDKGPERWMPPNNRFACQHLQNWLAIKFIWRLNMTEIEVKAIHHFIMQFNCPANMFQASQVAVLKMRNQIQKDVVICKDFDSIALPQ